VDRPAQRGVRGQALTANLREAANLGPDLRAIARAPLPLPSPLQRSRPAPGRRAVHGDVVLAAGGVGAASNAAVVLGPAAPEQGFALAGGFFRGSGYAVVIAVESAQPTEAALHAAGWRLDEQGAALVLFPIPVVPPPPRGLSIRPVTTDAALAAFMPVSETGPNGVVAAPEHRRHGFGAAMTWAAVNEGVRRGCTAMMLTTATMGYPVYLRMGFVPVCTYRTYLPPG
jgi:GNAT superfamily N-acetyltransferase